MFTITVLLPPPDKYSSFSSDTTQPDNSDYHLHGTMLGENITEGKRYLQNTFQIQSLNNHTAL